MEKPNIYVTIHLVHGDPIRLTVVADEARQLGVGSDLERGLQRTSMAFVIDGRLTIIPVANIKMIEFEPIPADLPVWLLQGTSIG